MGKVYFDFLDNYIFYNNEKIKYVLAFFYYPVIIVSLIYFKNTHFVILSPILLLLLFFSPMLMIPSLHGFKGRNYFIYVNLCRMLDESNLLNSKNDFIFDLSKKINYSNNWQSVKKIFFDLKLKTYDNDELLKEKSDIIKHNVKLTNEIENNLNEFFSNEAKKYFDILIYDQAYLLNIMFLKGKHQISHKIELYKDLNSNEINSLIVELKKLTGISKYVLAKMFLRFKSSHNQYFILNWGSIKSSMSQNYK
ncbi:hypothetical protein [Cloacibacterium normanense]|uniref:hypothetical protein n=1 Tax=Cloacibacterium normanense TaxID=237258 RepID=UPI00391DEFED